MEAAIILLVLAAIIVGLTLLVVKLVNRRRYKPYASRKAALEAEVASMEESLSTLQERHAALDAETQTLQVLASREQELDASLADRKSVV